MQKKVIQYSKKMQEADIEELTIQIKGRSINKIFGVMRGGVYIAATVAARLKLPFFPISPEFRPTIEKTDRIALIDDVVDTGATLVSHSLMLSGHCNAHFTFTIYKSEKLEDSQIHTSWYCRILKKDEWVIFPWENETDTPGGVEQAVITLLRDAGEDPRREGLKATPTRFAKSWKALNQGYGVDIKSLFTTFDKESYDEMVILRDIEFVSLCVDGKTFIPTKKGVRQARHIEVGDKIKTFNGGSLVDTEVKKVITSQHKERLKIKTTKGNIVCSEEHPLMTKKGWKKAGELNKGDELYHVSPSKFCRKKYPINETGYSLGYILGTIVTDGRMFAEIKGRVLRLQVKDKAFCEKFVFHFEKTFKVKLKIDKVQHYGEWHEFKMYRAQCCHIDIIEKIQKFIGKKKHIIPKFDSKEMLQGYLDGCLDGDGSYNRCLIQKEKSWLEEISKIIKGGKPFKNGNCWGLYIKKRLPDIDITSIDKNIETIQHDYSKIISIEKEKTFNMYKLYDFECSPYPTFISNGFLSKNCEHHLLPFFGQCSIAYVPDKKIVGISKLARLVNAFSRRLQNQERMVYQIAQAIEENLNPLGVAVIAKGKHLCMVARGVQKQNPEMITSRLTGVFRDNKNYARAEFLKLIA